MIYDQQLGWEVGLFENLGKIFGPQIQWFILMLDWHIYVVITFSDTCSLDSWSLTLIQIKEDEHEHG